MNLCHKFGSRGIMEGESSETSGSAVNSDSGIIVADASNHRVQVFDQDGGFKFQFGEVGMGDCQMYFSIRAVVARATLHIIVIERALTHQSGSLELQHPRGVAVNPVVHMVVIESRDMRNVIVDKRGNLLRKFITFDVAVIFYTLQLGILVKSPETFFISDNLAHFVKVFSYTGAYLRQIGGEGVTNVPVAVCLIGAGYGLVANKHRGFKVIVFTQEGVLLKTQNYNIKHTHCFDVAYMDGEPVVLASKYCVIDVYHFAEAPQAPADAYPLVVPVPPSSLLFRLVSSGAHSSKAF
ncbi:hypothetical protein HPB48_017046 [Haemaphysalis longicornis]|uniref:NHL repeat protein n=1 Tax=Haemaphysalis longicornis TaxID=44386 RepID=A0A9J6FS57_HAELO|nr:hypothetical protein HPB48_017046 [Haemaphysalis longicornis]